MRETASTFRMPGLFKLVAIFAVTVTLLITSGCGNKCCKKRCNSCDTCNVSAAPSGCSTCATGNCGVSSSSSYSNVGQAPQSLSEPSYSPVSSTAPSSSSSTYSGTNATFDRVGGSQDLPVFGAAPTGTQPNYTAPASPAYPSPIVAPAAPSSAPAQLLPATQPRSSGSQYHTLQKGETVYAISRQYGVSPKAVLAANQFQDPNRLSVGTKILIPAH